VSSVQENGNAVLIAGPTASGKSALALELAQATGGLIINTDSMQVYRDLRVITARPTPEQEAVVPHRLYGHIDAAVNFSAGSWVVDAAKVLAEARAQHRLPIFVGGSGLYLRALLEGLFSGPPRSEDLRIRLRERAAERGNAYLHRLLQRIDPAAARTIHANDVPKVVRALEVSIGARAPMTGLWQQGREPLQGFRVLRVGLNPDRDALYARINQRAQEMFSAGLLEETRILMERYGSSVWPLNSLGYKQAMQPLSGELSLEQAIIAAQQGHRNYAKRQMTWFRREPDVHWIADFGSNLGVRKQVMDLIKAKAGC